MKILFILIFFILPVFTFAQKGNESLLKVKIANGWLEGIDESGVISFKGVPFAAPPVGDLRWKEPQPVQNWDGMRKADKFGPKPMQRNIFGDMNSLSEGMSEDCLYLNVWTPAKSANDKLPVLVYFYGGGLVAGDGSEYRYDGESMARKGIVTLTANYRLNLFGFFAYPELTKESPHHSSGNYGYLDQVAVLKWVQQNIAAFGGDPNRVTIAGESAGSISVSALMASPLSKNLFAGAIGSSGSVMGALPPVPLKEGEQKGVQFAHLANAKSLADLRKIPAEKILEIGKNREFQFLASTIDGYFFPEEPVKIYESGQQAHVPSLIGWNSAEVSYQAVLFGKPPTKDNYMASLKTLYKDNADTIYALYPGTTADEIMRSATDLASDRFIAQSTWKWCDEQSKTGGKPVYRYLFARSRPAVKNDTSSQQAPSLGAVHSSDIEYAMGNLPTNKVYDWQPEDYVVSEIFESFYANFVKSGNPNGLGVPEWIPLKANGPSQIMVIDFHTYLEPEPHPARHEFLDSLKQ